MGAKSKYICPPEECSGCMACLNICAHNAINIEENELGFRYPVINEDKCIECGLCKKVCPQLYHRVLNYSNKCYAASLENLDELLQSASGGVATAISRHVLNCGGIVVGCSGEDMEHVRHVVIDKADELWKLKGSKYVQSEIEGTLFKRIRSELIAGRKVLFIGTGCQVAGLQNYLMKRYENLITVDLVCHGVPSQRMLNEDIELYPSVIPSSISFRKKFYDPSESNGTDAIRFGLCAKRKVRIDNSTAEEEFFIDWYKDAYLGSFLACINFREGCYRCLYARPERGSDLTICDFWGLGKDSILSAKPGVSAILINSENGERVFKEISGLLIIEEREISEAVRGNGQLQNPSPFNKERERFLRIYKNKGLKEAYRKTVYWQMVKKEYFGKIYKLIPGFIKSFYRILKSCAK